jgi:hypothetical protein
MLVPLRELLRINRSREVGWCFSSGANFRAAL